MEMTGNTVKFGIVKTGLFWHIGLRQCRHFLIDWNQDGMIRSSERGQYELPLASSFAEIRHGRHEHRAATRVMPLIGNRDPVNGMRQVSLHNGATAMAGFGARARVTEAGNLDSHDGHIAGSRYDTTAVAGGIAEPDYSLHSVHVLDGYTPVPRQQAQP
jgi:hypothetical protein